MTLSIYDYGVIAFYFLISLSIGFVFQRFNKDTSDYFRGGGSIVWQVIGSTSFMSFISAFTYTGAAGKAYQTGTLVMVLYFANGIGFLVNGLYFAKRYRQSRLVTAMEMVRDRFGKVNEQVFTWMVLPFGVIHGGVLLYSLAIIIATLFGIDMTTTILLVGGTVLVVSLLGVATSWYVGNHFSDQDMAAMLGIGRSLSSREIVDLEFFASVMGIITVCSVWFIGSRWLQSAKARQAEHQRSQPFFERIERPVDFAAEHGSRGNDATQFAILGWICVVYGGFFLAMMLIPNSLTGRACYGFMALANLAVGALFIRNGRRSSAASQQQALS